MFNRVINYIRPRTIKTFYEKQYVFNIVGEVSHVDKASIEIKNIIKNITSLDSEIISESTETINKKLNTHDCKYFINKYYLNNYFTPLKNSIRIADDSSSQLPVTALNGEPHRGENSNLHLYNLISSAESVTLLCRYIRNTNYNVHPWCFHVDKIENKEISDFMKICNQVNCVYPLNSSDNDKKNLIHTFLLDK